MSTNKEDGVAEFSLLDLREGSLALVQLLQRDDLGSKITMELIENSLALEKTTASIDALFKSLSKKIQKKREALLDEEIEKIEKASEGKAAKDTVRQIAGKSVDLLIKPFVDKEQADFDEQASRLVPFKPVSSIKLTDLFNDGSGKDRNINGILVKNLMRIGILVRG